MDTALTKLRLCHASGNISSVTKCRPHKRCTVLSRAAAPLTHSQRTLLHTAIRRGWSSQSQQEEQGTVQDAAVNAASSPLTSHNELQMHADVLLEQLVAHGPASASPGQQLQQQPLHHAAGTEQSDLQDVVQPRLIAETQQQQQQQQDQHVLQRPDWDSSFRDSQDKLHLLEQRPQREQHQQRSSGNRPAAPASIQTQQQLLQQQLQLRQLLRQQEQRRRQLELQLRTQPAVLTTLIKGTTEWQQLQHLFSTYTAFFNPVHVSAALTHLAQMMDPLAPKHLSQQPQGLQQLLADLASATAACVPDYGPRQLANTLWAINRLGYGAMVPRKTQAAYLAAFSQKMYAAAPQHISNVALAVAGMGWGTSTKWRQCLVLCAEAKQDQFNPQELANFLYALPLLEVRPSEQWLAGFLDVCYSNLQNFNSQELSLVGMALVRLNHKPSDSWLAGYMSAIHEQLDATGSRGDRISSSSSNSSNCSTDTLTPSAAAAAAAATDKGIEEDIPEAGAVAFGTQQRSGFQAQGLVNVLRVLSCWGVSPYPAWRVSCLAVAEQLSSQLSVQGTSTLIWALAKLQLAPSGCLLATLLQRSQQQLQHATPTDLALLAWGSGTLGVTVPQRSDINELGTTGSAHVSFPSSSADGSNGSSSSSSGIGRGVLASWVADFLYYSYRSMGAANARDVACLLVGVVRMHLRPDSLWLEAAAVQAHHKLHCMTATELTSSLLCLARLKLKPNAAFMATFCSCSNKLLTATAATRRRTSRLLASSHSSDVAASLARQQQHGGSSTGSSSRNSTRAAGSTNGSLYCPQTLANTLGAMAVLHYQPHKTWCCNYLAASRQLLPLFKPQDFSFTIWGLAQLDIEPPAEWLDVFLVQLRGHVPTLNRAQLSSAIWALAKLNHRPGVDWMQRFLDRVVALTRSSAGQQPQQQQQQQEEEEEGGSLQNCSSNSSPSVAGAAAAATLGTAGSTMKLRSSKHMQSVGAPPTVLQLSADFSSVILHGLTMWAVQRLEYHVPSSSATNSGSGGSSRNDSWGVASSSSITQAEPELMLIGMQQSRAVSIFDTAVSHEATTAVRSSSNSSNGAYLQDMQSADVAGSSSEAQIDAGVVRSGSSIGNGGSAAVATTVSRDGSIVFHF